MTPHTTPTRISVRALTAPHAWIRRPTVQDTGLALALFVVCLLVNNPYPVVEATAGPPLGSPATFPHAPWWWGATAIILAAVALRRRGPVTTLAAGTLAAAVHVALAVPPMAVDLGVLVLLYTVAAHRDRALSIPALGALLALVGGWSGYCRLTERPTPGLSTTVVQMVHRPDLPHGQDSVTALRRDPMANLWSSVSVYALTFVAAWSTGSSARNRRAFLDQLRVRTEDLERDRDQRAALAVAVERDRISREMHDVVAHGLSLIVIQAQGGAAALQAHPADTQAALASIVTTGRQALGDMRQLLGALGEVDDAWHPQPGLAQLPSLLRQVRASGTPVNLRVRGAPAALPATVDLAAYRIVQESLTNIMKHALPGTAAEVILTHTDREIRIAIRDNGMAAAGPGRGHLQAGGGSGLPGMRERVTLLGGSFSAGSGPGAVGFVVQAALPAAGPATRSASSPSEGPTQSRPA